MDSGVKSNKLMIRKAQMEKLLSGFQPEGTQIYFTGMSLELGHPAACMRGSFCNLIVRVLCLDGGTKIHLCFWFCHLANVSCFNLDLLHVHAVNADPKTLI